MKNYIRTNSRIFLLVLTSLLIVLASTIRWVFTGSLKADNNYILNNDLAVAIYVISYFIGFWIFVFCYYNIVLRKGIFDINSKDTLKYSYIIIIIFAFMTVMFASDIYSYLAEGELATRGILTYTNGNNVSKSNFIEYISPWWQNCPNHYGPPLLFLFFISVFIGKTVMKSYFIFKFIIVLTAVFFAFILAKISNLKTNLKYNNLALIILSPLVLIEGVGQTHVEIIIVLFLSLFIFFFLKKKIFLSMIFLGLSISSKLMYGTLLIPLVVALFYVEDINNSNNIRKFVSNVFLSVFIILGVVFVTYIPIWQGIDTILNPINFHNSKTPCRSFTELIILVYKFGGELINNGFDIPALLIKTREPNFFPISKVLEYQKLIAPIFKLLGLFLAILNLLPILKIKDTKHVLHIFARLWIIVITIYSPIFNPWYFMPVLVFLIFTETKSWMLYAIFVISQSINGQMGNSTIPIGSLWEVFSSIQVIVLVPMFLIYSYKHLIKEPIEEFKLKYK